MKRREKENEILKGKNKILPARLSEEKKSLR